MTRFDPAGDPERIIRELEHRMQNYPLRIVRLTGAGDKLLGLFLLSRNVPLSETALQRFQVEISAGLEDHSQPGTAVPGTAADVPCQGWPSPPFPLEERLTSEIKRIQHASLPCALILLQLDDPPEPQPTDIRHFFAQLNTLVRDAVRCSDIILPCHNGLFAIILPGISRREATACAERIRRELGRNMPAGDTPGPILTASIGLGFCQDPALTPASVFTAKVLSELGRAREQGGNRICQAVLPADFSCQVSVEERAELFSIFAGDSLP
jgi:hypothetical protein